MGSLLAVQRRRRWNGKLIGCAKKEKEKWEAYYLCKEGEGEMGSLLAVQGKEDVQEIEGGSRSLRGKVE